MNRISQIKSLLQQSINVPKEKHAYFYKTGAGHYAEHDKFIGVSNPVLRKLAKEFYDLPLKEIQRLIKSSFNEERLLALFILVHQYNKATDILKEEIFQFYMNNLSHVNNWNLVDASAHLILGAHLFKKNKNTLLALARSDILWERRIAIVSTWYFIRNDDFKWTIKISKILLHDKHDLIHKAVGWMLREMGKRDQAVLVLFLNQHANHMPRTMLRYAIEKFPEAERKVYLGLQ